MKRVIHIRMDPGDLSPHTGPGPVTGPDLVNVIVSNTPQAPIPRVPDQHASAAIGGPTIAFRSGLRDRRPDAVSFTGRSS